MIGKILKQWRNLCVIDAQWNDMCARIGTLEHWFRTYQVNTENVYMDGANAAVVSRELTEIDKEFSRQEEAIKRLRARVKVLEEKDGQNARPS